jgi:hypothetical protein
MPVKRGRVAKSNSAYKMSGITVRFQYDTAGCLGRPQHLIKLLTLARIRKLQRRTRRDPPAAFAAPFPTVEQLVQ